MWPLISSLFSQSAASRPSASEVRSRVEALESRRNSGADGEDGPGLLRKSSSTILKMLGKYVHLTLVVSSSGSSPQAPLSHGANLLSEGCTATFWSSTGDCLVIA